MVPIAVSPNATTAVLRVFVIGNGTSTVGAIMVDQSGGAAPALELLLDVVQKHQQEVDAASVAPELNVLFICKFRIQSSSNGGLLKQHEKDRV